MEREVFPLSSSFREIKVRARHCNFELTYLPLSPLLPSSQPIMLHEQCGTWRAIDLSYFKMCFFKPYFTRLGTYLIVKLFEVFLLLVVSPFIWSAFPSIGAAKNWGHSLCFLLFCRLEKRGTRMQTAASGTEKQERKGRKSTFWTVARALLNTILFHA